MINFNDIPDSKHWVKIEFIEKGWSADKKYYIETDDGRKLVIRLGDISQYEKKKTEYEMMILISKLGIEMSQPIDFGTCASGKMIFILVSWLEGESAEDTLPKLGTIEQRNLGISAGKILKKIHTISAPIGSLDWETRITQKIETKLSQYISCGYTIPNDERIMRFIRKNIKYLRDRPQTLQHGDYHPGNFVITSHKTLGVLDFNRADFGDPWEEFVRVATFSKDISIPFSVGQINEYFNNQVPELFFKLMALYSAIVAHFEIIWSIPFGQYEIEQSIARSKAIFEDYHGFETYIPVWYK